MIRHELTTSLVRLYEEESDDPFAPYAIILTLVWETPQIVWMQGMHGTLTRDLFRQLVGFLHRQGIVTVKAHRHPAHRLPGGVDVGDHTEMCISSLWARVS